MDSTLLETATAWRQHLHRHPELSLHERETAAFVARTLQSLGIACTTGIGGHGVVGTISRGQSNRSVGLRADMDALPIVEATGAPHASTVPGVMHACGHDGHTAALLAAAAMLARDTDWTGTVQLVFQPAEEGYGGARAMLADGLLDRFPMERIFGWHNWPGLAAGTLAVHDGPVMAAGVRVAFTLTGHAGHAAMPHLTRDPVLAAAQLLVALQSIVSRNVDPLQSAVVSICTLQGGTATNQIPDEVRLGGTMRAHLPEVSAYLEAAVHRVAAGIAAATDVRIETAVTTGVRATINTAEEAVLAAEAGAGLGLPVRRDMAPSMASEDFGWYLAERPGAFAWIGNGPSDGGRTLHNAGYDFNDAILPPAASWLVATAKRALGR